LVAYDVTDTFILEFMALYKLKGIVQHYAWGGMRFIPDLLNKTNDKKQPYAELWVGTHVKGPSKIVVEKRTQPLKKFIKKHPKRILGKKAVTQFGEQLPFLFKVLDVKKMLSIQAHPTKKAAEIGFAEEEKLDIDRTAPNRTYRDANHKPEVMVALSTFWLLHGFKSITQIQEVLEIPEFQPLKDYFVDNNVLSLYKAIMEMPQSEVNRLLTPLDKRLQLLKDAGELEREDVDYWAAKAFDEYTIDGQYDRGIFSIYLMNLVRLKRGEGIYQAAGIPHAYLEGINVELMANSDNVFRGGLTQKHINVTELLKHLDFKPILPKILKGVPISALEKVFKTPTPDFELSQIKLPKGNIYRPKNYPSVQIFIVIEGEGAVLGLNNQLLLKPGDIFLVEANTPCKIMPKNDVLIFKAKVPV